MPEKRQHCLTFDNQYFEIDVYPFWNDKAIVEIELRDEHEKIRFPKEFQVLKEGTEDPAYKNAFIANSHEI